MNKNKNLIAVLLVALSLNACGVATVTTDNVAEGIPARYTSHRFLWGLTGADVNTGYQAAARIEVYTGITDFLARLLTVGLYWPYSVEIWAAHRYGNNGGGSVVFQQGQQ